MMMNKKENSSLYGILGGVPHSVNNYQLNQFTEEIIFRTRMIDYIQTKIDNYQKMDNMHQIIDILRALICDIKIDIKRMEEAEWKKGSSSK